MFLRHLKRIRRRISQIQDSASSPSQPAIKLSLTSLQAVHHVSPCYLSFSIDISVVAGGFWWEGSQGVRRGLGILRIPPLNLKTKKLDRLVKALGPSYLRVGGSEADKIHYFHAHDNSADELVLTHAMWDDLHAFIRRNELRFFFTFKYGLFARKHHGDWRGTEIEHLLRYSQDNHYRLDVCELGNELNAYWAFHGIRSQPTAKNLAQDYATFIDMVRHYYPDIMICGPGSAFWPHLGETVKPFSNLTQKFLEHLPAKLDIVDWHYYPFQSDRSPLRTRSATIKTAIAPKSFETFALYSKVLCRWRDMYQPQAQLWTGETGSAQCGGQAKISDRFASCFWWADQLGQGAVMGQKVMVRQSLIGGDYGLIDRLRLKPRPDYWISWLWCQLMGEAVYSVNKASPNLRTYCHQHKHSQDLCLLIINLACKTVRVDINDFFNIAPNNGDCTTNIEVRETYTLSAKKLTSKRVFINGVRPEFKKGRVHLNDFPASTGCTSVPPSSINFWRLTAPLQTPS